MVLSFKHGNALYIAPFLAQGLLNIGSDLLRTADLILPVPLHWRRLYNRGFNQAAVVAQHLGKISHKPVSVNILKRIQNTPFQGNLSLEERIKNVAHCFKVSKPQKIKNKSILLVDDVMTTGATLNACAKTLLKVGAKEINVLCVARVKAVQ
jgi:ComF family protein